MNLPNPKGLRVGTGLPSQTRPPPPSHPGSRQGAAAARSSARPGPRNGSNGRNGRRGEAARPEAARRGEGQG